MCGICGIFHYATGAPVDARALVEMRERMVHRGPDDAGLHVDGPLGIAVRRLSILDVLGGHQPLAGEADRVWTAFNGEIYNFRELRRELLRAGHAFRTGSDTEVVVHAYEQWGLDVLERLNGMFGLAIWDADARRLLLARDPFGVKPLYVWDDGATLVFASELRSLLAHPLVAGEVDLEAVHAFLELGYVPAPATALRGIAKLPPGHAIVVRQGSAARMRRFAPRPADRLDLPEGEIVEELRRLIRAAVERQLVSDVPLGAMLSGGIDSTTIASIMAEVGAGPLRTFTVGFEGGFGPNELDEARATADRLGSDHHEVVLSRQAFLDLMPRAVAGLEEPVANPSAIPFLALCEVASQAVKVALSGQGADEPFAGYARHVAERYGAHYRALPHVVRERLLAPMVQRLPRNERLKRAMRSIGTDDRATRMQLVRAVAEQAVIAGLLGDLPGVSRTDPGALWEDDVGHWPSLDRMLYVDARTSLADNLLLFGDKMGMAASLEVRVPYLDHDLMAFAERIPASSKVRHLTGKRLFREAVSAWTPADVVRRKKVGFVTPVDAWLRAELRPLLEERLLAAGSPCRSYVRPEMVRQLVGEHELGRHDHKRILFALLALSYWQESIAEAARPLVALG